MEETTELGCTLDGTDGGGEHAKKSGGKGCGRTNC